MNTNNEPTPIDVPKPGTFWRKKNDNTDYAVITTKVDISVEHMVSIERLVTVYCLLSDVYATLRTCSRPTTLYSHPAEDWFRDFEQVFCLDDVEIAISHKLLKL